MAPDIDEAFEGCEWQGPDFKTCDDLFSPLLTETGICYTFNMLRAEELFRTENLHNNYQYIYHGNESEFWTLEKGYAPKSPIKTYPHRGVGYGANGALVALIHNKKDELDYICSGAVQGSKVILHNPAELPRPTQQYFRVPLTQEVVVAIKPKVMTTSDSLENYDPERRLCFFPTERYLRYFKVYTQANCELECLSNYTYTRCGCVHVAMPHSREMKVCDINSIVCLANAKAELLVVEMESDLEQEDTDDSIHEARQVAAQCNCMPACTSIEYEAETSQDEFDWKAAFRAYKIPIDNMNDMYSRVMVFFKEPQFIKSQRSELYGQTDFLANCGGLLGLFMGFSILSLVEIAYFLTLRLFSVLWTRKANKERNKATLPSTKHINEISG